MQNKIIALLATLLLAVSCLEYGNPYDEVYLNTLTVKAVYPAEVATRAGATVVVDEVSGAIAFSVKTQADGSATLRVPNGIYRITVKDREEDVVLNASEDKVKVCNETVTLTLGLKMSKTGSVVIKEIYCGGCSKAPAEGNYQSDKYIIIHNNIEDTYYLDGLCMGTLSPYNSTASNPWETDGSLPDFLPVIQAVLSIPGDGTQFPLEPGEDAIVALCGAIDHKQEYPLSVNLNRADVFALYDPVLFPNPSYHPAPGPLVLKERYLDVVIKTGQANAYTLSVSSPTFILFRAPKDIDIREYVLQSENQPQVPGGSEKVVAIPRDWVIDGVEVFDGTSSGNHKRLPDSVDAGAVSLTERYKGHTLYRRTDPEKTTDMGFEVLMDSNNSSDDFYERDTQSINE